VGFEVVVPLGFDLMKSRASFDEWRRLGVKRADRKPYPAAATAFCFSGRVPGPAFVTSNFDVIKDYNDSDVYALAIGHLSDLMQGGGPIKTPWPAQATQLPRDDRIAMQKARALGYDQTRFTAHIDFKMRDFVRAEQKSTASSPTAIRTPRWRKWIEADCGPLKAAGVLAEQASRPTNQPSRAPQAVNEPSLRRGPSAILFSCVENTPIRCP
jgi:hypothetical protein